MSTASSSVFAPEVRGEIVVLDSCVLSCQWTEDYDLLSHRLDAGEGEEPEEEFEAQFDPLNELD
ncbi:hypothetical protein PsorP6_005141 [Peronosclerospora sorghi]|uniref:Uncharacterized protein n=1 Tax=Peronosclerospora sorghi TaxID=230839 RepID=A0ACC0W273_9STRA|nr:hypothetical protein PsorP6_005141 [Peronosclerospora sorghi]